VLWTEPIVNGIVIGTIAQLVLVLVLVLALLLASGKLLLLLLAACINWITERRS